MRMTWVGGTALLFVLVACGNGLKEGWTEQLVAKEKQDCVTRGQTAAICNCYVDKASQTVTYAEFQNPGFGTPAETQLTNIANECSR